MFRLINKIFLIIVFQSCIYPVFAANNKEEILDKIRDVLFSEDGYEMKVTWDYTYQGENWQGDGSIHLLGNRYLHLVLPFQEVLIQDDMITTKLVETDQVIIDYFSKNDPSSIFSILLNGFHSFVVTEVENRNDGILEVECANRSLVGFEKLKLTLNENSWIPVGVLASAGEDIQVTISVNQISKLTDDDLIKSAQLTGTEIIDLR